MPGSRHQRLVDFLPLVCRRQVVLLAQPAKLVVSLPAHTYQMIIVVKGFRMSVSRIFTTEARRHRENREIVILLHGPTVHHGMKNLFHCHPSAFVILSEVAAATESKDPYRFSKSETRVHFGTLNLTQDSNASCFFVASAFSAVPIRAHAWVIVLPLNSLDYCWSSVESNWFMAAATSD